MTTYRAAYYTSPTGGEVVLTAPEHATLPAAALVDEAVAEARRAGLIGDEEPRITEDDLRAGLTIGEWREAW